MKCRHLITTLCCVTGPLFVTLSALAQPRYRTYENDPEVGYPARWESGTVTWDLDAMTMGADVADWERAADAAFAAWASTSCMDGQISFSPAGLHNGAMAGDGRNTITLVRSGWRDVEGRPMRGAVTDVHLEREAGGVGSRTTIVEADIYVNVENYAFTFDGTPEGAELDAQAVLTHEVGHLIGLLHPCEFAQVAVPPCTEELSSSAVFPTYEGTQQRQLSSIDVEGVCDLYRRTNDTSDGGVEMRDASVPTCSQTTPCASGVCAIGGPQSSSCVPHGTYGAPCEAADDCGSELCLIRGGAMEQFCTRGCRTSSECGSGMECAQVDARLVCRPGGGLSCAAHPRGAADNGSLMFFGLMAAAMLSRRATRGV